MHRTIAIALLTAALPAQALTLTVNDSRSHGVVGDGKLSLDEAVQIVNQDNAWRPTYLATMGFSAAELAQIAPRQSMVDLVSIDTMVVPTIVYERELTPVVTSINQHQDVMFEGMGNPTLDAKGFSAAFPVRTNHIMIHGLHIVGGQVGIDADASLHFHPAMVGEFMDLTIEGQSQAAIRFPIKPNPPGQALPFLVRMCAIRDVPIGIEVAANALFPFGDFVVEECMLERAAQGVRISAQTTGGVVSVKLIRTRIVGSDACVRVLRPMPTSCSGRVDVRVLYGELLADRSAIDVQGVAGGDTFVDVRQALVRGGAEEIDFALRTWPKAARFDVAASESTFVGNVAILAGVESSRIWLQNDRFESGSLLIDDDGPMAVPDLRWNVLDSCPVTVAAASSVPFTVVQCELVRSPVQCLSTAGGAVKLDRCYRGSSPISGGVTDLSPAGARWLCRASVVPTHPLAGSCVDLQLDYPTGMLGAWVLGASLARPDTTTEPFRFYLDLIGCVALPGPFMLRDSVRLQIPAATSLVGLELFAQPVAMPMLLQPWQEALLLPAGGRFVIE